jgi:hypothetical protein
MFRAPDLDAGAETITACDAHRGLAVDLFFFWRYLLAVVVGVYCVITAADRLIGCRRLLHGEERHWSFARKYLVIQLLRVRWRDVGWELTQIACWLVVLAALVWGHRFVRG